MNRVLAIASKNSQPGGCALVPTRPIANASSGGQFNPPDHSAWLRLGGDRCPDHRRPVCHPRRLRSFSQPLLDPQITLVIIASSNGMTAIQGSAVPKIPRTTPGTMIRSCWIRLERCSLGI